MCDIKVQITRVRTGCLTCRSRKKKCDEQRPVCTGCTRNGFDCTWPSLRRKALRAHRSRAANSKANVDQALTTNTTSPRLSTFNTPASPEPSSQAQEEDANIATTASSSTRVYDDHEVDRAPADEVENPGCTDTATTVLEPHHTSTPAPLTIASPVEIRSASSSQDSLFPRDVAPSRPLSPSSVTRWLDRSQTLGAPTFVAEPHTRRLWDYCGEEGFSLLGHYLSQTSLVLSGGILHENPFLSQLMPIAMSNDLIMHLVLTVSAAHSAVALPLQYNDLSYTYYNRSLALFRKSISSYVSQTSVTPIVLALGSLLLCFTETVRGDCDGAIFKHLKVADTLIVSVLSSSHNAHKRRSTLEDFLVEFYIYVVTLSLVSIDPQQCNQFEIHELIQSRAHLLASESFIGSLCGCWIELLLLIPRINTFAAEYPPLDASMPALMSGDRMAQFATLHTEILLWSPPDIADSALRASGLFYQNAILLYLYTSAFESHPSTSTHSADLIGTAISAALAHLDKIDPEARINTILCWPVAITGSCISDQEQRSTIRHRLQKLKGSLKIANITDIMDLLEALWDEAPNTYASPWRLHDLMKSRNLSFSFA